jgi:hypothetical protein
MQGESARDQPVHQRHYDDTYSGAQQREQADPKVAAIVAADGGPNPWMC